MVLHRNCSNVVNLFFDKVKKKSNKVNMEVRPIDMRGFRTIYISAGSRYHAQTPLSEFQAVPVFVRSPHCLCISLDDYPLFSQKLVQGATLVEYPCNTLDFLHTALQSLIHDLKNASYSRLFFVNFVHFRMLDRATASERQTAATVLSHFTQLPPFYRRHVYNWGGYEFPSLLIQHGAKLPTLNPMFITKIMERNREAFAKYTLDITDGRITPPFRLRKTARKRVNAVKHLRAFKTTRG